MRYKAIALVSGLFVVLLLGLANPGFGDDRTPRFDDENNDSRITVNEKDTFDYKNLGG